ncbi:hypothetical protein JCM10207_009008 [Rhodosporidiobolus poonsookiae]
MRSPFALLALLGFGTHALARFERFAGTKTAASTQTLNIDFSDYSGASGDDARSWLANQGLVVSDITIGKSSSIVPYARRYVPENVDIVDGLLRFKVDAERVNNDVISGEIATEADNILYGTFKTVAKATSTEGTCLGFFTYTDDNHELDIEFLSSYYTEGYDTYTLVWTANSAEYYVDGEYWTTLTRNIPTIPAQYFWNFCANGNLYWSAGPPPTDAFAYIKSISLEYTTA